MTLIRFNYSKKVISREGERDRVGEKLESTLETVFWNRIKWQKQQKAHVIRMKQLDQTMKISKSRLQLLNNNYTRWYQLKRTQR